MAHSPKAKHLSMRQRRKGCIVNISSLAGLRSAPALGFYNATKFAVEGLSGALLQEVEPLGIKVMVVEPISLSNHPVLRLTIHAATFSEQDSQVG
jgi:short-subunit dehydrogenase